MQFLICINMLKPCSVVKQNRFSVFGTHPVSTGRVEMQSPRLDGPKGMQCSAMRED